MSGAMMYVITREIGAHGGEGSLALVYYTPDKAKARQWVAEAQRLAKIVRDTGWKKVTTPKALSYRNTAHQLLSHEVFRAGAAAIEKTELLPEVEEYYDACQAMADHDPDVWMTAAYIDMIYLQYNMLEVKPLSPEERYDN